MTRKQQFNWQMGLSVLAAVAASIGDTMILYSPNGGYELGDFQFLNDVPFDRALVGHFLGVIGIPVYLMGLWWVTRAFAPLGELALRMAWGGVVFVMSVGCAYHAMVSLMGLVVQEAPQAVERGRMLIDPLGAVVAIGFALMSLAFLIFVLRGQTRYPRWVAWVSPLPVYLLFALSYLVVPSIGNYLIVAGFNCCMAIFLAVSWGLGVETFEQGFN